MTLEKYNQKRNFNKTNEPKGKEKKKSLKRFVIQFHKARRDHYDFRLEYGGVLLSWAVPKGLSLNPNDKRLAVMVEDHPVDYINFEGIIPKGNYGAGTVDIFDSGTYLQTTDFESGLEKGHIKFVLNGKKLKGGWSLVRTSDKNWIIVKSKDEFASEKEHKSSSLPFKTCKPKLAQLSTKIPSGKDWVYEIKYDGYRILSYVQNQKAQLFSRNNLSYTKKFENIAKSLEKIEEENFVLDGEVVAFLENGKSDFSLLQEKIKKGKKDFHYVIFDLLALNGEDLKDLPLEKRKQKLERLLHKCPNNLIYSSHVKKGKQTFLFAKENNLEGIIAKKLSSTYDGERNENWLKIKCYQRQEFVICGYTTTDKNQILSALILGYFENKKLCYVGKVGTGLSEETKQELIQKFKPLKRKTSPFENVNEKNAIWLKPVLVCEVQFANLTTDNLLRQPSFVGLREDKNAKQVKLEISSDNKH